MSHRLAPLGVHRLFISALGHHASRAQSYLAGPPIALQKPVIALGAAVGRRRGYRPRYD